MTRWISYSHGDGPRVGVVTDGRVLGLPAGETLRGLLERGELVAAAGRATGTPDEVWDLADVRVEPLLTPPSIRDSMCFHQHIRNCRPTEVEPRHAQWPIFYYANPQSVIGADDPVRVSPESVKFDYELEVGVVIGAVGDNLAPADAEAVIAGYTVFIDWSARDLQRERIVLIKGKDGATTLGPVLVTPDELEDRRLGKGFDLAMTVARNGVPFSVGNWSTIDWSFADIISYVSRGTRVVPGDVIGSGTVGWGCLLEYEISAPERFYGWLTPGDRLTFEVERIGRLEQTIVEPLPWHPLSSGY